jgi:tetratricopeptide (TPR) repeat protein
MPRRINRLLIIIAGLALITAGVFLGRKITLQRNWEEVRPMLPPLVGSKAPGLDERLAGCMQKIKRWPPDQSALAEFSRTCHANGFFDEASSGYRELIKIQPAEPRWPYLLALIVAGYGRLEEAIPLLRQTTLLAPDYIVARLKLGDALLKSNSTEDADAAYREVLRREPQNHYALLGLARCDLQTQRLTAARGHLQQAVALHPDFTGAQSLLGTVFERLGNPEAAALARAQIQAGGHYIEPPDGWAEELALECHDPYTLLIAASAAQADGNPKKSMAFLHRGLSLAPNDARLHRQLGKNLMAQDDLAGARTHLERAVAIEPSNDAIRLDLVRVLRALHEEDTIAKVVAEGLLVSPESAAVHFEAGMLAARAGRLDEAAQHLSFTWRTSPDQTGAALELAEVDFRNSHDEAGIAVLEESLARHPQENAALVKLIRHGIETRDARTAGWLQRAVAARPPADLLQGLQREYQRRFGVSAP